MVSKSTLSFLVCLFTLNLAFGQFNIKYGIYQPTGISNSGQVAGYAEQAGPYSIWNPDTDETKDIGGKAPGLGIGGQAQFSENEQFLSGTSRGINGIEMSRYYFGTQKWVRLGSLGVQIDNSLSGGFTISGDGKTVAGLSWTKNTNNDIYAVGVAWNPAEGLMDLGSLFTDIGRSTRVNAASYDGKVLVGWQDFNGPWKSAVWRKDPAGGYFQNEYILIDENGDPNDEFNQMGECSAVSSDGNWIGGYGDYANNNQPWIWNQDSGIINLGSLPDMGNGYVSGINADGSVVVGWFDGMFFGDPQLPFIWTPSGGLQEFNTYVKDVLGYSLQDKQLYSINGISPNGKYVTGYGVDFASFESFAYRVGLVPATGIHNYTIANNIKVYPNPSTNYVTIDNKGKAVLTLRSIDGKIMESKDIDGKYVLDISEYATGTYILSLLSDNVIGSVRIVKD